MIQIINGLVYGSFLYLLSVGLVLIFGLRRVTNFAHGGLFMLGAYISYAVAAYLGFWTGMVVSVVALAALGVLLDRFVFRPLAHEDAIVTLLVTFGLLFVVEDLVRTIWGKDFLTVAPPQILSGVVPMFGATFPVYRLFVIAVALAVAAGLAIWLRSSRVGLYVRASSVDPVTTGMQGVDTDRLSALVVAIGTGLAGLSGTIAGPLLALSSSMGGYIIIDCFVVVVTGGLTSFTGVFIAALLIGQVHNLGIVFVPELASMLPLAIMALVLTLRPQGLAGAGK
ncbi:branched-chain amino acid ABC transporter permease [Phreatobacter aquaticus]|uniref:Branched-chain amino acid ABC transporter permease n=1 Tax=Phreatobacter aquaticus TaxID=2570229 RepID=A0A4D7QK37_9HYPH|nr:branched-chain amino acid ABC transporter permease [Phreatobacter aquaticus]QCK86333.1 branched-chain amino acid ABC transporter permease [Phreatobacter aquaticus]